jgi:hypothetical protein
MVSVLRMCVRIVIPTELYVCLLCVCVCVFCTCLRVCHVPVAAFIYFLPERSQDSASGLLGVLGTIF